MKVGDSLATDPARRLKEGEVVELLGKSVHRPKAATTEGLVVRHLDDHVVVVEKPAGVNTVRHPSEWEWPDKHRRLDPTLQDLTQWAIAKSARPPGPVAAVPADRAAARQGDERAGRVRPVGAGRAGTRAFSSASTPSSAGTSPSCRAT